MSGDHPVSLEKQLFDACYNGQMDVIDTLLEAGVDVNVPFRGMLPLQQACIREAPWVIDVVTKLLIHGADVDLDNEYGWNALDGILFSFSFQPHVAQLLLDCSKKGFTKLNKDYIHYLHYRIPEAIKFIHKNGFDTNCVADD